MAVTLTDRSGTITPLIAWLSTCLIAAGVGPLLDSQTHILWLRGGCFGLVAALGLEVAVRSRARLEQARRRRQLQKRCDRSLERYATERDCEAERNTAIVRLLGEPITTASGISDRRHEPRAYCSLPVEVFPVRRESETAFAETDDPAVTGRLVNLSNSGFGVELDQPVRCRLVVISLLPPYEEDFDLLGELLWSERNIAGKVCGGGRLLRVLLKCAEDEPIETSEEIAVPSAC